MKKVILLAAALFLFQTACERKTTRKVIVDTPEKRYEVEVEKTESN